MAEDMTGDMARGAAKDTARDTARDTATGRGRDTAVGTGRDTATGTPSREYVIEFRIDRHSGVATYLQIVHQTEQALRMGLLEPGDKLPAAREVVEATAINPNTVLKAYRELERSGLVEARRGLGTFVRRSLGSAPADSPLRAELDDWARRAREAGLDREDVAALFASALDTHFGTTSTTKGTA